MHAIILAAGQGKRLAVSGFNHPKSLLSFRGQSLIQRLINSLNDIGFETVDIVTGFKSHELENHIQSLEKPLSLKVNFLHNDKYAIFGNFYSLVLALKKPIKSNTWVFDSDCVYDEPLFSTLRKLKNNISTLLTTELTANQDKVYVSSRGSKVLSIGKKLNDVDLSNVEISEYIGVFSISKSSIQHLIQLPSNVFFKEYEDVINSELLNLDFELMNLHDLKWHEVDNQEDYNFVLNNWNF
jgi:choline kinase